MSENKLTANAILTVRARLMAYRQSNEYWIQMCRGRFARSIETGWVGVIIDVETDKNGDRMLMMAGVDGLAHMVAGGDLKDFVDMEDIRWFDPRDLLWLNGKKIEVS